MARAWSSKNRRDPRGFSLLELLIVLAISMIVAAIAVPAIQSSVQIYRLRSAAASVKGAIQGTRYRAISSGYPFALVLSKTNSTYQVQSDPTASGTFTNVGSAIPLSGSSIPATINQDVTLQFRPSGAVTATTGTTTMLITYFGRTETIQVSNYGNITVTP
ncbi:MAG: prepilin-type N-terminal cleavage/methylation domain-containing protein [Acidobacteriia bacterium]|nr:prepilin-type N-terminal cleavage/methylation domain-containing protein [Terriglobia bacterium]